jgi:hypothetical protein
VRNAAGAMQPPVRSARCWVRRRGRRCGSARTDDEVAINDAPAPAAADVGIDMRTGTGVAIESAGITLVKGDLAGIVQAGQLSHAAMKNLRQNLFFASIYTAASVPIAGGAFFPFQDRHLANDRSRRWL